jgi:hypothetical protein
VRGDTEARLVRTVTGLGVVAVVLLVLFFVLSFTPATTPDGSVCGNFWGRDDIPGCGHDGAIRRAQAAGWAATAAAAAAAVVWAVLAVARRLVNEHGRRQG